MSKKSQDFSKTPFFIGIIFLAVLMSLLSYVSYETDKNIDIELSAAPELNTVNEKYPGGAMDIVGDMDRSYSDSKDPDSHNQRSEFTSSLKGEDLVAAYFEFGNQGEYRDACSLLQRSSCNSAEGQSIEGFSRYWDKLDGGYDVVDITLSNTVPANGEAVYCVSYEYSLKQDVNPETIAELFQYRVRSREDGLDEITSRVCESKTKGGLERACEIQTSKFYCK